MSMEYPEVLTKLKLCPSYDLDQICTEEFPRIKGTCYLDHAATTLYGERQLRAVFDELKTSLLGNPHSRHESSEVVSHIIDVARNKILKHFNTDSENYEVIFTSGATDALKMVATSFQWMTKNMDMPTTEATDASGNGTCFQADILPGIFAYTMQNHTSVLGIRGPASRAGVTVECLEASMLQELLYCNEGKEERQLHSPEINCETRRSLFAYSAQCNFSGVKYPLDWIDKVHNGALDFLFHSKSSSLHANSGVCESMANNKWYVVLDAASFAATCPLDLSYYRPDFVPISFYKLFGYPTGLGCLLVSRRARHTLEKEYFGGGTVLLNDARQLIIIPRPILRDRFEDGTLPFLNVVALLHGFDTLVRLTGSMDAIMLHVFNLAQYAHHCLRSLRHGNGALVAELYGCETWKEDAHGSIINFNLKRDDGSYVGYAQIERVASIYKIHLRTGCVCNPGGCQHYLNISSKDLANQFKAGHVCGDNNDLVNGHPTGSVRISFGYMSRYSDVDILIRMVVECFVEGQGRFDVEWMLARKKKGEAVEDTKEIYYMTKIIELKNNVFVTNGIKSEVNVPPENASEMTMNDAKQIEENRRKKKTLKLELASELRINVGAKVKVFYGESENSNELTVTDIIVYPVKSCCGFSTQSWQIGMKGLAYDRDWMIISETGAALTQKRCPQLTRVVPSFDFELGYLLLTASGYETIKVPLQESLDFALMNSLLCNESICGGRVKGRDCGDAAGNWLSLVLGLDGVRLVRQSEMRTGKRSTNMKEEHDVALEELSFCNLSQYVIIHRPSVHQLIDDVKFSQRNVMCGQLEEVNMISRFRANLVLDGGRPYDEDNWSLLTVPTCNVKFKIQGPCERCKMISVDQVSGIPTTEPLLTLAAKRGRHMYFGVHASAAALTLGPVRSICPVSTLHKRNVQWWSNVSVQLTQVLASTPHCFLVALVATMFSIWMLNFMHII